MDYEQQLALAVTAAKKAGDFLRNRSNLTIDSVEGKDIKLSVDKLSESIIINTLLSSGFPVLSEESGFLGDVEEICWIVDPLDGSMNYYKGLDDFSCISIALWKNGEPVLGVINRFFCDEIFTGVVGAGAKLNGMPIKPSETTRKDQAIMATGFPVRRDYSQKSLSRFIEQVRCFKKVRMLGAAAIMAVFVACGRLDAYFEEDIMLWDIAAAMAIVEAAGGSTYYKERGNYKCLFRCFSTNALMEDFNAKGV